MRTLVVDARLLDGGPNASVRPGELLIEDDRIAAVGEIRGLPSADRVVNARGAVLSPGFIDAHSHGDFVLPQDPGAEPKIRQGITTEVVGNCGLGIAPATPRVDAMYRQYGKLFGEDGDVACSPTVGHLRARLERVGISVNVACLVPHGNLRCAAMGLDERPPTSPELRQMAEMLELALAEGAVGMSTGLVYPPGAFAGLEELIELASVTGRRGGIYASHVRDEGPRLEAAIAEALTIGARAGLPVQISHHKAGGRPNWGKVRRTLGMLEEARARGVEVHSDMYPYTAGSTMLAALVLPLWVFAADSPEASLARLSDPATRGRLLAGMRKRIEGYIVLPGVLDHLPKGPLVPAAMRRMADMVVVASTKSGRYEGRTLREVAQTRGAPLLEAILDLLAEEEMAVTATAHMLDERDVRAVLADPFTMVGTDGMPTLDGRPHPRGYGTFPRVLEQYVGRLDLFGLPAAVHKMTGLPASKFGLGGRGRLEVGARADLVLFEPRRLRDRATYADPRRSPEGIDAVWVAGEAVVEDGRATGRRPGRVLRGDGRGRSKLLGGASAA